MKLLTKKIWFQFLVNSNMVWLYWGHSSWSWSNPNLVVSGTGVYLRRRQVQFRLMRGENHFLGMQTKLSSFVAIQIFGSCCQIKLKVKLLKEMVSRFLSNRVEYRCADVFLRGTEPTHFSCFGIREIFSAQSGSVRFGQRLELLSRYPNQIIYFFAINFQNQLPDLITQ